MAWQMIWFCCSATLSAVFSLGWVLGRLSGYLEIRGRIEMTEEKHYLRAVQPETREATLWAGEINGLRTAAGIAGSRKYSHPDPE